MYRLDSGRGGGRLYHPPKVFFPPPPSCSCSCSAPSPNAGLKHQAGMAPCHPTCPHYKYQMKEFFFLFIFFSSLLTRATQLIDVSFLLGNSCLLKEEMSNQPFEFPNFVQDKIQKPSFSFSLKKHETMTLINDLLFPGVLCFVSSKL